MGLCQPLQKVHVDRNGGPTPRRRSAAHAPSTRRPSHLPLPRASTRHTIPHASPPTNRTSHSTALPPAFSTLHSITHNPCTHTPTTCLRAETSGLPVRIKKTQTRSSGRTGQTTSHTTSVSTTRTRHAQHQSSRASSARKAAATARGRTCTAGTSQFRTSPCLSCPVVPEAAHTSTPQPRARARTARKSTSGTDSECSG